MTLTLHSVIIDELLDQNPCYNPLHGQYFAAYNLRPDTEFNIFDIEQAYNRGLVESTDLAWLVRCLNWFVEEGWKTTIFIRVAELKEMKLESSNLEEENLGILDRYATDMDSEERTTNEFFFQVVHELSEGTPLINWEVVA